MRGEVGNNSKTDIMMTESDQFCINPHLGAKLPKARNSKIDSRQLQVKHHLHKLANFANEFI